MALNLIEIKDFPKTASLTGTGEEIIPVSKADGKTYGIKTSDFKAFLGTVQQPRPLAPTDPAPTVSGVYIPTITDNVTYANAGDITVNTNTGGADYGRYPQLIRDDEGNWSKVSTPLPQPDISGVVAQGDAKAVSGDTVFKAIRNILTNVAVNGSFDDGLPPWNVGSSLTDVSVANGVLSFTGTGSPNTSSNHISQIISSLENTDKVYVRVMAKGTGTLYVIRGISNFYKIYTVTDDYKVFSNTFSDASTRIGIAAGVGDTIDVDSIMVINLTKAFGTGQEPSTVAMDAIVNSLGGYFDGTKTFSPSSFSYTIPEKANHGYLEGEVQKTLKEVEYESLTAIANINNNGNFASGLAPWTAGSSIPFATVSGGILTFEGAGLPNDPIRQIWRIIGTLGTTDKVYIRIVAKGAIGGRLYTERTNTATHTFTITNEFKVYSVVLTNSGTRLRIGAPLGEIVEVQSIMVMNLTVLFGAGKEPGAYEIDALIETKGGYFEGAKIANTKDYRSVFFGLINENENAINEISKTKGIGEVSGIAAMGASLMYDGNTWFNDAANLAGITPYNKAISGTQPYTFADQLWRGNYCTAEEFENMDILAIQFASSSGLDVTTDLLPDASDYVSGFDINNPANQFMSQTHAQNVDYILKYWRDWCYAQKDNPDSKWYGTTFGKPLRVIIVSHWHDSRAYYNDAIRVLASRWGFVVCEIDKYIGFSKNQPFNGQQVSIMYAEDTQDISGVLYGWHPLRGLPGRYIQKKMANIFYHAINQYFSMY